MPWLSEKERHQAIGMLTAGATARDVARLFGCCRKTIERLAARYRHTGTVRDQPRAGRPRVTTARTDRFITLTHLRQRRLPATVTARRYGTSAQNNRSLRGMHGQSELGAHTRVPYWPNVIALPDSCGADVHLNCTRADWNRVCFQTNLDSLWAMQMVDACV